MFYMLICINFTNMKKLLLVFGFALIMASAVYAQKMAKFKKGVVTFGDLEFLKYDCKYASVDNCLFSNFQGEKVLLTKAYFWKTEYVPNNPQPIKRYYYEIEFWDTDLKMYSTEILNYFFKHLIEYKVFNDDGSLNYDKAAEFVKIHGVDKPDVLFVD